MPFDSWKQWCNMRSYWNRVTSFGKFFLVGILFIFEHVEPHMLDALSDRDVTSNHYG